MVELFGKTDLCRKITRLRYSHLSRLGYSVRLSVQTDLWYTVGSVHRGIYETMYNTGYEEKKTGVKGGLYEREQSWAKDHDSP